MTRIARTDPTSAIVLTVVALVLALLLGFLLLDRLILPVALRTFPRFSTIAASDLGSLPPEVPADVKALFPPSARDLNGTFDVDSQEYRTTFSYSDRDDIFLAETFVEIERDRGPIDMGGEVDSSWWPHVLQGGIDRSKLTAQGMLVLRPRIPLRSPSGLGRQLLVVDSKRRVGFLYVYYQ